MNKPPTQIQLAFSQIKKYMVGVGLISGVTNILMLTGPLFMMQIYDRVLASRSVPTLIALSILVVGLYVYLGILEMVRSRALNRISQRLEEQGGADSFRAALSMPLAGIKSASASLPVRDLDQLRQFMSGQGPIAILDMPWMPIYLTVIFFLHAYLGWLAIAGAVLLLILTLVSEFTLRKPTKELSAYSGSRNDMVEAGTRNSEVIHAMGMTDNYCQHWQKTNQPFLNLQSSIADKSSGFSSATKIFRLALQSAVLALGAYLAIFQEISPGSMIAASILTSRALSPVEIAVGQWKGFVAARQAYERLCLYLPSAENQKELTQLPIPTQNLKVEGISVGAPGTNQIILQGIDFALSAGDGLGIIGPSGSGKSTLARALTGVWPMIRGSVRLDGAEIEQWSEADKGKLIGYLPQTTELFAGTVAQNISRFMENADPDDIIKAAKRAGIHEFVLGLEKGYDTQIGVAGATLSAGQRQRVGLARALFGEPFLIVLDEPNSNLDAEGEVGLAKAIHEMRNLGRIVVVIAHRPNALATLNLVLVIKDGRQAAFGDKEEVLNKTTSSHRSPRLVAGAEKNV